MTYDPNGYPTSAINPANLNNPDATLNSTQYPVTDIIAAEDVEGSIYSYNYNQVGFSKTLIINRIYNLINKTIGILQKAAAAQANRINFLTQWQKAYTDVLNQVHTFTPYNGDAFSDLDNYDDEDDQAEITTMQQNLNTTNSTYTTAVTNRRSIISDATKSMQTYVTQTTDAINAQTSLATSFLQTLSSLTSAIFRSS